MRQDRVIYTLDGAGKLTATGTFRQPYPAENFLGSYGSCSGTSMYTLREKFDKTGSARQAVQLERVTTSGTHTIITLKDESGHPKVFSMPRSTRYSTMLKGMFVWIDESNTVLSTDPTSGTTRRMYSVPFTDAQDAGNWVSLAGDTLITFESATSTGEASRLTARDVLTGSVTYGPVTPQGASKDLSPRGVSSMVMVGR